MCEENNTTTTKTKEETTMKKKSGKGVFVGFGLAALGAGAAYLWSRRKGNKEELEDDYDEDFDLDDEVEEENDFDDEKSEEKEE